MSTQSEFTGKNPHGGGGNQWIPLMVWRQGNFGVQRTFLGKVTHARKRHRWTANDLYRVQKAVIPAVVEDAGGDSWTIWDFIIDTILHVLNGVSVLSDVTTKPTLNSLIAVFDWLKANKGWEEKWRPRWERAWGYFWDGINGQLLGSAVAPATQVADEIEGVD